MSLVEKTLYLHDSAIDLYHRHLQEDMGKLPDRVLVVPEGMRLVVFNYDPNVGAQIGYGFHRSDPPKHPFLKIAVPVAHGTILSTILRGNDGVKALNNAIHIENGPLRYSFMRQEFDLDVVSCVELATKEMYKKS
jgi:hypothetical protein